MGHALFIHSLLILKLHGNMNLILLMKSWAVKAEKDGSYVPFEEKYLFFFLSQELGEWYISVYYIIPYMSMFIQPIFFHFQKRALALSLKIQPPTNTKSMRRCCQSLVPLNPEMPSPGWFLTT